MMDFAKEAEAVYEAVCSVTVKTDTEREAIINMALRLAYRSGEESMRERAAGQCATSTAGDCCHETASRSADAIRALPLEEP